MYSHINKLIDTPLLSEKLLAKIFLIDHIRYENLTVTVSNNNLTHYLTSLILDTDKDDKTKELIVIAFEDNVIQTIAIE